jgi:hypothetical protein
LNSNLDAKNDFIAALQENMREKKDEAQYCVMQLEKSSEVIKDQEEEIVCMARRPQTKVIIQKTQEDIKLFVQRMKTKGTNTESNDFTEIIKVKEILLLCILYLYFYFSILRMRFYSRIKKLMNFNQKSKSVMQKFAIWSKVSNIQSQVKISR